MNRLEKEIRRACVRVQNDFCGEIDDIGWGVRFTGYRNVAFSAPQRSWWQFRDGPSCCPIGAVLLTMQPAHDLAGSQFEAAASALGVDRSVIGSFIDGFDGAIYSRAEQDAAYRLGRKIRREVDERGHVEGPT